MSEGRGPAQAQVREADCDERDDGVVLSDVRLLPRRVHPLRTLGMALGAVAIAAVLLENGASLGTWLWLAFTAVVWPQLALILATRSADPYRAELRNLLVDSALAGIWVPLMYFNALPSVLLVMLATVDKINTGVRGLWLRSLPGLLAAMVLGALLTGFAFSPESTMTVILASLPMLVIHTVAASRAGYHLVRRVQRQNRQLDALSRIDSLTGLGSRRHWEQRAGVLMQEPDAGPMCLLLIDIDDFKPINDRHGHAIGDDVLRVVSVVIRSQLAHTDLAARYGGDELAAIVAGDAGQALDLAERLRVAVASLAFAQVRGLSVSVSIGVAPWHRDLRDLRAWVEAADHALYRAKSQGRNRVCGPQPVAAIAAARRP